MSFYYEDDTVLLLHTRIVNEVIRMPPRDWRKKNQPVGYTGFARKAIAKKKHTHNTNTFVLTEAGEYSSWSRQSPRLLEVASQAKETSDASLATSSEDEDSHVSSEVYEEESEEEFVTPKSRKAKSRCSPGSAKTIPHVVEDQVPAEEQPVQAEVTNAYALQLSLTLEKKGTHVLPVWIKLLYRWIELNCIRGGLSRERGPKNGHLHGQGIIEIVWDPAKLELLKTKMKEAMGVRPRDQSGCYIYLKVFDPAQDWVTMVG